MISTVTKSATSLLAALTELKNLDLDCNQISDIAPLANLTKLDFLQITRSQISDIAPLATLTQLKNLKLIVDQISDITPLATLTELKNLSLFNNQISDIAPLATLSELEELDLSGNQISDVAPLATLTELESLRLNSNQISDITPLATLIRLKTLNLVCNQISNIEPLTALIRHGMSIRLEFEYEDREVIVGGNPLSKPPREIVEQGNEAILAYFESLQQQGSQQLNEAKLIIVGEPRVGKTSLMEKLLNPDFELTPDTESTLGVTVREGWEFQHPNKPDTTFTANIWDFGGQQIQYMTHQFFLTPGAAYVLVTANDREDTFASFPYWFKIIQLLGKDHGQYNPVLVIQNDKDGEFNDQFNLPNYQTQYSDLQIEHLKVDLKQQDGRFRAMLEEIQSMLTQLPHVTAERPAYWEDIRVSLRKTGEHKAHINWEQYTDICDQHGVTRVEEQKILSKYLHRLGSLLHYVDDEIKNNGGYFTLDQLKTIWCSKVDPHGKSKYTLDEQNKLLKLMKKEYFEVCYKLGNTDTYIAPQLLDNKRPAFDWEVTETLQFRYQYDFMPEGIITRLIVRLNHLVEFDKGDNSTNNKKGLHWQKGVVFNLKHSQEKNSPAKDCRALVVEQVIKDEKNEDRKAIDIAVSGELDDRKYLHRRIREEIDKIHQKWFRNIRVEQMIPCVCSHCVSRYEPKPKYFEYGVLLRAQDREKATIECDKQFIDVPVKGLLEGVFDDEELEKKKSNWDQGHHSNGIQQINNYIIDSPGATSKINSQEANTNQLEPVKPEPPIPATPEKPTPWYKAWWVVSAIFGLFAGIIAGLAFLSIKISVISAVIVFIITNFMNPKRRFFRVAWTWVAFALPISSPLIANLIVNFQLTTNSLFYDIAVELTNATNPWLVFAMFLVTSANAGFMFWLDSREK